MRVLLVEDDVPMASALRRALKAEGAVVDVATTGADARWMVRAAEFDAVVLDVMCRTGTGSRPAGGCGRTGCGCRPSCSPRPTRWATA